MVRNGGALVLAAWLGVFGAACTVSVKQEKTVQVSSYDAAYNVLRSKFKIDEKYCHKGSDRLLIFLPEVHILDSRPSMKKHIETIDKLIPLDCIGLESIAGNINLELLSLGDLETSLVQEDSPQYAARDLKMIEDDLAVEVSRLERTYEDTDSPERLFLRKAPLYFGAINKAIVCLRTEKVYRGTNSRRGAPGISLASAHTRASLIGMETASVDLEATALVGEAYIARGIDSIDSHTNWIQFALDDGANLGPKFDRLKDGLQKYRSFLLAIKPELESYRARNRATISEQSLNEYQERQMVSEVRLVVDMRSEEWVKNLSKYHCALMVGGSGHRKSVYESAKTHNCSLITLGN